MSTVPISKLEEILLNLEETLQNPDSFAEFSNGLFQTVRDTYTEAYETGRPKANVASLSKNFFSKLPLPKDVWPPEEYSFLFNQFNRTKIEKGRGFIVYDPFEIITLSILSIVIHDDLNVMVYFEGPFHIASTTRRVSDYNRKWINSLRKSLRTDVIDFLHKFYSSHYRITETTDASPEETQVLAEESPQTYEQETPADDYKYAVHFESLPQLHSKLRKETIIKEVPVDDIIPYKGNIKCLKGSSVVKIIEDGGSERWIRVDTSRDVHLPTDGTVDLKVYSGKRYDICFAELL